MRTSFLHHLTLTLALTLTSLTPAQSQTPPSTPEITRPQQMMDAVDKDTLKELRAARPGKPPAEGIVDKADQQLQAYGEGKTGSLRLEVAEIRTNDKGHTEITAKPVRERIASLDMQVTYGLILDPSQQPKAATLKPGTRLTATGTPWSALTWSRTGYQFSFWLDKAILK